MELYINERSINSQANNKNEAIELLTELFITFSQAKKIANGNKGYISSSINEKLIYNAISVKDLLVSHLDEQNPAEVSFRKLAMTILFNKPRISPIPVHNADHQHLTDEAGACLKNTCFDHAASSTCSALVISMGHNKDYESECIKLNSSIFGQKKILNITGVKALENITWVYEHNPKHKKTPTSNGSKKASAMSLSQPEIELVLLNGVLIKKRIYGYHKGIWYKFHCEENNKYHAFEFSPVANDKDHNLAVDLFTRLKFQPHGQIFSEYL